MKKSLKKIMAVTFAVMGLMTMTFSANAVICEVEGCVEVECTEGWCGIAIEGSEYTINCGDNGTVVTVECDA